MLGIINMVFIVGFIVVVLGLGVGIGYILSLINKLKYGCRGKKNIYNSMNRKRW